MKYKFEPNENQVASTQDYNGKTYTVSEGDELWLIAEKTAIPWKAISDFNQLSDPEFIYPGQVLRIPEND